MEATMKGNGQADQGLLGLNAAFEGAKYTCIEAHECAQLMMMGRHREQEIPDGFAMALYDGVTRGQNQQLMRRGKSGAGYVVHIESYKDLASFFKGTLEAIEVEPEAVIDA